MQRRGFLAVPVMAGVGCSLFLLADARALTLSDLTNSQATQGLRTALETGARAAIATLGAPDGFLGNDKVRIPLPGYLNDAAKLLRGFGQGARLDDLVVAMNRAAEAAVPQARDLLVSAVKTMNVQDAKNILRGGDTAVTLFFADKTRAPLGERFLPIVSQTTSRVGLADKYNQIAAKASALGLVKGEQLTVERYVTSKALDGLYLMIGEEERKIRSDPIGTGSAVLQKVFGALK